MLGEIISRYRRFSEIRYGPLTHSHFSLHPYIDDELQLLVRPTFPIGVSDTTTRTETSSRTKRSPQNKGPPVARYSRIIEVK